MRLCYKIPDSCWCFYSHLQTEQISQCVHNPYGFKILAPKVKVLTKTTSCHMLHSCYLNPILENAMITMPIL